MGDAPARMDEIVSLLRELVHDNELDEQIQATMERHYRRTQLLETASLYFAFPTFLVSAYGMNVSLPFAKNRWIFCVLLVLIVVWSLVLFALTRSHLSHRDSEAMLKRLKMRVPSPAS